MRLPIDEVAIDLPQEKIHLKGFLNVPEGATKLIIFAHGSGSGRHSPRNQYVAKVLQKNGIGTLLLDLLTAEEELIDESTRELRFNIPMLAKRLAHTVTWAHNNPLLLNLKVGFFGASTGSAAALIAASKLSSSIFAVVSRGGRPDLALDYLQNVKAPTLLIVGGNDGNVIELNKIALQKLECEKELTIVPEATHLFEEPGALEQVASFATDWFLKH